MPGRAIGSAAGRREDRAELGRRSDLELVVAAIRGPPVGAPTQEGRRVAEAVALQVVVLDLADALDPQGLPRQVLAGAPSALRARHPRRSVASHRPIAPRTNGTRIPAPV